MADFWPPFTRLRHPIHNVARETFIPKNSYPGASRDLKGELLIAKKNLAGLITFAFLPLAHEFARAADSFLFFTEAFFRRFFKMAA